MQAMSTDNLHSAYQQGFLPHRRRFVTIAKSFVDKPDIVLATLDVKLKAPNGANVNVKGKQAFDGSTTASVSAALSTYGPMLTRT